MTEPDVAFLQGPWDAVGHLAAPVRVEVFVDEQGVPPELEWDEHDPVSMHWVAVSADGEPVAAARLRPDGHVGRMAVRRPWRGRGVGRALMRRIADHARAEGMETLMLAAQLHALAFYESLGFEAYGPVFVDAGIDHRMMHCTLSDS